MQKLDETHPDSQWITILERAGHGDQVTVAEERQDEQVQLWQESLKRRDQALEALRAASEQPPVEGAPNGPAEPTAMEPLAPLDVEQLRMDAEMGRWAPEFPGYSRLRRWFADKVSGWVLTLTGFIHVHQRRFNHGAVDQMVLVHQRLDQLLVEVNRLNQRLAALEGWAEDDRPPAIESASLPELRREVYRLQRLALAQTVELADLQTERLSRRLRRLEEQE